MDINFIKNLKEEEKIKIYLHYYIKKIGLKYNFHIVDFYNESKHGWGEPNKVKHNLGFYYLWDNILIKTYEEFIDLGDYLNKPEGIYYWYYKFKHEL